MERQKFRIVLAAPTVLYAPLYLAKSEALTHVFKSVEFTYARSNPQRPHDTFAHDLMTGEVADHTLFAVGDPLRLFTPNIVSAGDRPVVVGGLITKMCLWLCSRTVEPDRRPNRIFAPPIGTTGDVFARHLCEHYQLLRQDAVYQPGKLGDVRLWYDHFQAQDPDEPYAFVTADPPPLGSRANGVRSLLAFTDLKKDDANSALLTGLITSESRWRAYQGVIEEIRHGIHLAIQRLHEHPGWSAACLSAYGLHDQFVRKLFTSESASLAAIMQLRKMECFNFDGRLRVDRKLVSNAVSLRTVSWDESAAEAQAKQVVERACTDAGIFVDVDPCAVCQHQVDLRCGARPIMRSDGRHDISIDGEEFERLEAWTSRSPFLDLVALAIAFLVYKIFRSDMAASSTWDSFAGFMYLVVAAAVIGMTVPTFMVLSSRDGYRLGVVRIGSALGALGCLCWTGSYLVFSGGDRANQASAVVLNYLTLVGLGIALVYPSLIWALKWWPKMQRRRFLLNRIVRCDYFIAKEYRGARIFTFVRRWTIGVTYLFVALKWPKWDAAGFEEMRDALYEALHRTGAIE